MRGLNHIPVVAASADEATSIIKSGMRLFVHGAAATPTPLIEALVRHEDLRDIELYHLHTQGPAPFVDPEHRERFPSVSLFTGAPVRRAVEEGAADFIPVFLSDIPSLFLTGRIPLDVALLQLSPPDAHGYCSLGTSVDAALAASLSARCIVAEINERMPRIPSNQSSGTDYKIRVTSTSNSAYTYSSDSNFTIK